MPLGQVSGNLQSCHLPYSTGLLGHASRASFPVEREIKAEMEIICVQFSIVGRVLSVLAKNGQHKAYYSKLNTLT